jgi:AAA15 family ATPase/GTPase
VILNLEIQNFKLNICSIIAKLRFKIFFTMIIEFSITNFGSIKEKQTLSFEATKDDTLAQYYTFEPIEGLRLLKLAMIFGPNASGKSTVLKAFEFLRNIIHLPAQNKSEELAFEPFGLDEVSKNESSYIELLFITGSIKFRYNLEFNKTCILNERLDYSPRGREANFFTRRTDISTQSVTIEYGSLINVDEKNKLKLEIATLWNNPVLGIFSKANIDFPELKMAYNWFGVYLLPMISPNSDLMTMTTKKILNSPKIKEEVTRLLKYADVQIENVEVVEKAKETYKQVYQEVMMVNEPEAAYLAYRHGHTDRELVFNHLGKDEMGNRILIPFKIEQESQGTLRYYGLSGVLATLMTEPKMVSIDEFESSLHPDLAQNLILRFLVQSKAAQLLVTSHNIDFLGEQDVIRRDTIWFTQKDKNGATELYSAADFDTSVLRKTSSLLNVYETGKLGAKPNLGSIFS